MARAGSEITSRFGQSVSNSLLSAILNIIYDAYKSAHDECEHAFDKNELKNILPHYRWAKINTLLRGLSESLGVSVTAELNKSRNSYHALLVAGGVRMTPSAIENRNDLPREALFRETYAEDNQLSMFDDNAPRNDDAPLYGLILHAPSSNHKEPRFVDIAFPDSEYKRYVGIKINLFQLFPETVASRSVQTEEFVATEPQVTPRRRIAKKNERSA